jgi:hypothetical protein
VVTLNGAVFYNMTQCCTVNFYRTTWRHIPEDSTLQDMRHLKNSNVLITLRSLDIAVGIPEFESRWGQEFTFLHVVQTGSGAHPASHRMSTGGEGTWCGADHSPPTSAEVNKMWIYISTPPIRLHGAVIHWLRIGTTC